MADQVFRADSPAPDMRWVFESLLAILDTAVSLQPETETLLRHCAHGEAGGVACPVNPAVLARQAGRLTSALLYLVDRANALPGSLLVDEALGLLRYHHRLLTESLGRVGPGAAPGRSEQLGPSTTAPLLPNSCDCLGEPAARLRRLRGLIASDLSGEGVPPTPPLRISHPVR